MEFSYMVSERTLDDLHALATRVLCGRDAKTTCLDLAREVIRVVEREKEGEPVL